MSEEFKLKSKFRLDIIGHINCNYKKFSQIFIIIFSFLCFNMVTHSIDSIGEYETYTLATAALQYEHTIYISEKTFENEQKHFPDYYKTFSYHHGEFEKYSHYPRTKNGEFVNVSWYFPAYSASCIPVSMILEFLGLNQSYAFVLTNFLLLVGALLVVYKYLKVNDKTKFFLLLVLSVNPIIYYLKWASAEVFICTFVIMSLVFFFNKAYKRAAFFLTIGGAMNTPLMALGIFMIIIFFIDLQKEKGNGKNIIITIYNNFSSIIKYAAAYSFIFLAFIYNYIASRNFLTIQAFATDFGTYYFDRFFAYLFDLNFGLLPWFFIIFILYIVVIGMAVLRLKYRYFLLAAGHICVVLAFSLHLHINCGMSGIARYNAWIAPVMLFITIIYLFEETSEVRTNKKFSLYRFISSYPIIKSGVIILSVIYTVLILFQLGFRVDQYYNYITMQSPARSILNRIPNLYNPLYSTFISRVEHRDGGYDYREPVFYIDSRTNHDDEIRKILIKRNEKNNIKDLLEFNNESSRLYLDKILKKITDKGNEFVYLSISPKYKIEKKFIDIYINPLQMHNNKVQKDESGFFEIYKDGILFGPYITLKPGSYLIILDCDFDNSIGNPILNINTDFGKKELQNSILYKGENHIYFILDKKWDSIEFVISNNIFPIIEVKNIFLKKNDLSEK